MKKFLISLFFLVNFVFAEEVQNTRDYSDSRIFSEMFVALECGQMLPLFSLKDAIDRSLYGALEFRYSYFFSLDGYMQFGYSHVDVISPKADFSNAHQFNGRLGVLWRMPFLGTGLGAGFSCIWARSSGGDPQNKYGGRLADNESEFGVHARFNFPVFKLPNWNIGFNFYYEQIWTAPERSNTIWAGIYLERRVR